MPGILSMSWNHLSCPRLGRPKNNIELVAAEKQHFIDDQRQRNDFEGKISEAIRARQFSDLQFRSLSQEALNEK
jgi:hypothetical protein